VWDEKTDGSDTEISMDGNKELGTYLVHMGSSCIYCAYELIKFIKNLKKFTHVLSILLNLCIKFQCQILNNEGAVKKIKFLTDL
jgi:hypothetical protein